VIDPASVAALVRRLDSPEEEKSRDLILMLLDHTPAPFSRDQFTPGHITCTGLVLHPDRRRILLVHHRRLERWLLPGGHVEPEDPDIWDTARREVIEETGAALANGRPAALIGVDVHGIPGKRREPYHLHHDLLFRFTATSEQIQLSEESRDVVWCARADFDRYALPPNVRRAALCALSSRPEPSPPVR